MDVWLERIRGSVAWESLTITRLFIKRLHITYTVIASQSLDLSLSHPSQSWFARSAHSICTQEIQYLLPSNANLSWLKRSQLQILRITDDENLKLMIRAFSLTNTIIVLFLGVLSAISISSYENLMQKFVKNIFHEWQQLWHTFCANHKRSIY